MLTNLLARFLATASYRFVVMVDNVPVGAFTECTLPTLELEVEEVKEGGLNTYVHQLPGRRRPARLTLKNGVGLASTLLKWYIESMDEEIDRRRVTIVLLNSFFSPVMVWHIEKAYPVKWTGPQLQSDANAVAIQTLELVCGPITTGG
jgi:phage tail-like protein